MSFWNFYIKLKSVTLLKNAWKRDLLCVTCYFVTWPRKHTVGRLYLNLKTVMNKTLALTLRAEYIPVFPQPALCACINADEKYSAMLKYGPGVKARKQANKKYFCVT